MSKNKSQARKLRTPKPTFERNANFPSIKSALRGRTINPTIIQEPKGTVLTKNEKRIQRRKKLVEITR
jgi:hypothetical protein